MRRAVLALSLVACGGSPAPAPTSRYGKTTLADVVRGWSGQSAMDWRHAWTGDHFVVAYVANDGSRMLRTVTLRCASR